jgi:hypothetical protein
MNFKTILLSAIFVACSICFLPIDTFSQETKPPIQRRTTHLSYSYAYKLTNQDFANTPSWNPSEDEPPLSVNNALKIARENLPRFVKNAESWKMRMIMLQSMEENKWYYRIHFFCFGATCREVEDRSFTAIVKMNGTLVEPKKVTVEQ